MTSQFADIVACLEERAARVPNRAAFEFWSRGGVEREQISYGELHRRAAGVAGYLQSRSALGDRVLLLFPPGLDFIVAFFGCLYARRVAVPVPAPHPLQFTRVLPRLRTVLADAKARLALGTGPSFRQLSELRTRGDYPDIDRVDFAPVEEWTTSGADGWMREKVQNAEFALLQYTSGSTSAPKGVILTHSNLMANVQMIGRNLAGSIADVRGVFWLPLYHDMGLIGGVLGNVFREGTTTLMSPLDFIKRPIVWLQAIAEARANISGAPDFGYQLAIERTTEEERSSLDLSSWQVAFSGAERIRPNTLRRFAETFAPHGFRKKSLYGTYGLAEATLLVSSGPVVIDGLDDGQDAHASPDTNSSGHVTCGSIADGLDIAIVDPSTGERCPSPSVGEIWVKGPSVAGGYWERAEESQETFGATIAGESGTYLRTGDLGFMCGGQIFVTGRIKDLIIIGGQNHYPEDIEATLIDSHPLLRGGECAAFGVEVEQDERLVVAVEIAVAANVAACDELAEAIRAAISTRHLLTVYHVAFVRRGRIPKTSSGKLQRRACREQYLSGALEPPRAAPAVAS